LGLRARRAGRRATFLTAAFFFATGCFRAAGFFLPVGCLLPLAFFLPAGRGSMCRAAAAL
jgi:hypothetical protein